MRIVRASGLEHPADTRPEGWLTERDSSTCRLVRRRVPALCRGPHHHITGSVAGKRLRGALGTPPGVGAQETLAEPAAGRVEDSLKKSSATCSRATSGSESGTATHAPGIWHTGDPA
jgi:hypothetical protein